MFDMQTQTIVFFGPQGSGKGTQTATLIDYLKSNDDRPVIDLETGRGFREMTKLDTYTGERVRDLLENGELVPNFLVSSIVMSEVAERLTIDSHLVIDGFPRNVDQARVLEQMLSFYKRPSLTVIGLDVPDDVVIKRMMGRGRADDTPELISERLRLYHEQTKPLIEHYNDRPNTNFVHIDGSQSIKAVWEEIKTNLESQ